MATIVVVVMEELTTMANYVVVNLLNFRLVSVLWPILQWSRLVFPFTVSIQV